MRCYPNTLNDKYGIKSNVLSERINKNLIVSNIYFIAE
jgi:hypothetical protein